MNFCKEIKVFDTDKLAVGFPYYITIVDKYYVGILIKKDELKLEFVVCRVKEDESPCRANKLILHYEHLNYYDIKPFKLNLNS